MIKQTVASFWVHIWCIAKAILTMVEDRVYGFGDRNQRFTATSKDWYLHRLDISMV